MGTSLNTDFQYGTWIPTLQIGNGVIQGQYSDQTGHWTRIGHQIFVNGFFRLNYNEADVEAAIHRNTTVQEIRIGTLPFESNSGASMMGLMVSHNHFVQNGRPLETEILSTGARSIWGSPRLRIFANERTLGHGVPLNVDLSLPDLKPSTNGIFIEVRISGSYTAFPDLSMTDPVNTPPPIITGPTLAPQPVIEVGSRVRVNNTARTWATGQTIPSWVHGQVYTVQQLRHSGEEVLLQSINSWIRSRDVTLLLS